MTEGDATVSHQTAPAKRLRASRRSRPATLRRDELSATRYLVMCYLLVGVLGLVGAVLLAMMDVSDAAVAAAALITVTSLRTGGQIWRQRNRTSAVGPW